MAQEDRRVQLLEAQADVLGLTARNEPIDTVLAELCRRLEVLVPGSTAGVCILDRASRVFERSVFPSLEVTFAEGIKGARVAQRPGSCAVAIYEGTTVTSENIEADDRFQDAWRRLNLDHGIRSIQSRPVFSASGISLGTFVLGFKERRASDAFDEDVAATGADLAGIALSRYRNEQQHALLLGEMQHRARNVFAMIGAIVYSTLRTNPDPIAFRRVFEGRLAALARVHSLETSDGNIDLRSLLGDILAPHGTAPSINLAGPPIVLAPHAAAAFALATNELATNATKYGALSNVGGRIEVDWRVADNVHDDPTFTMTWIERGGPKVTPPTRSGFGRTAIEESLKSTIDGEVNLDFLPDGLKCTIRAPLTDRLGARPT
jgi:two-component sensor histidine kinase